MKNLHCWLTSFLLNALKHIKVIPETERGMLQQALAAIMDDMNLSRFPLGRGVQQHRAEQLNVWMVRPIPIKKQ